MGLELHKTNEISTKLSEGRPDSLSVNDLSSIDAMRGLPVVKPTADLHRMEIVFPPEGQAVNPFVGKPDGTVARTDQQASTTEIRKAPTDASAPAAPPPAEKVSTESVIKTLQSADATAQQKIEALSKLYDTMPKDSKGHVHLTVHDGGKDKQFEISKENLGHGVNLTHLTYRDEKGHTHPVLRGVERKGQIEQELDKNGNKADFKGDWWSKHAGQSAISNFAPSADVHLAPVPPAKPTDARVIPVPPPRPAHLPSTVHNPGGLSDGEKGPKQNTESKPDQRHQIDNEQKADQTRDRRNSESLNKEDVRDWWYGQKNSYECGSASEAMAIAKMTGRRPLSDSEVHQLSRLNGTAEAGAFPHGAGNRNMEEQLKAHGVNAKTFDFSHDPHQEMNQLDAELAKGNSAVAYIRNPATGHGHFVFVAGKTSDNHYLIGDPGRHTYRDSPPVVSRETLNSWLLGEKRGSPYFVSVEPTTEVADSNKARARR